MQQPSNHNWLEFLREVRQELAKVIWPTRREVFTYTIVVLITVVSLGLLVAGFDILFSRLVLELFGD